MMPGAYPLTLYRGDSYHWLFTLWTDAGKTTPADLSGATAKAEIRNAPAGATIVSLVCTIPTAAPHNVVDVKLTAAASAGLPATGVWDLQITYTASGDVTTVLAGPVTVTADVTDSATVFAAAAPVAVPARVVRSK
jgi:hypothetical protein